MDDKSTIEVCFDPDKKIKIEKEEKHIEPVKSSSELLAELFQVFNAKPPEDLDDEHIERKHKHKVKKLKKEKHKEKKKKKKSDVDPPKSEPSISDRGGATAAAESDNPKKKIRCDFSESDKKRVTLKPSTDISISFKIKSTNKIDANVDRFDRPSRNTTKPAINDFYRSAKYESSSLKKYDHYRYDRRDRSRYSRSRSRSPRRLSAQDLGIDKKRLLETARKNVLRMLRTGTLPGSSGMTDEVKDRIVNKIRYSGKTVQDLTEFCKKISNGANLSDISSSEDSDIDKSGKAKPFQYREIHHPFRLQEKEKIVMRFGNNNNAQAQKNDEKSKEISAQFPVSSGEHHRLTEGWTPVEPKPTVNLENLNNPKRFNTKPKTSKEVSKPEEQEPAFLFTPNPNLVNSQQNGETPVAAVANNEAAPPAVEGTSMVVATLTNNPTIVANPKPDVSTIISNRLNAMRRLQTNPMDSEALKIMYNTQRDMGVWASSNQNPTEQLKTNPTYSQDHRMREPQAWAHPKQLISTVPLQGGMGMYLLKKMGWRPGEGLGPARNGALEPLLLDIKMDKKGLVSKEDENQNEPNGGRQPLHKKQKKMKVIDYSNKHPVCLLNELAAQKKWTPPFYELLHEAGPAHSKTFLFSVSMNGQLFIPQVRSNTKKDAKLVAAKHCLQQLQILPPD